MVCVYCQSENIKMLGGKVEDGIVSEKLMCQECGERYDFFVRDDGYLRDQKKYSVLDSFRERYGDQLINQILRGPSLEERLVITKMKEIDEGL